MNQIENLTPNHKPFKNRGQMNSDWGMLYIVGKIFLKSYKILPLHFQNRLYLKKI